jgi:hypothetical protein
MLCILLALKQNIEIIYTQGQGYQLKLERGPCIIINYHCPNIQEQYNLTVQTKTFT